jgi:hypothetical protein
MSRPGVNAPFIFTAAFVILVALLMTGLLPSPVVIAELQCDDDYRPPGLAYDVCKTQVAQTATAQAAASGTTTGGGTTSTPNSQPAANATATATRTVTATVGSVTPTAGSPQAQPPTATPTLPSANQANAGPTPTLTPTAPAVPSGAPTLVCVPGSTVRLAGEAAPSAQLLAFFDDRPVGGGFSRGDGLFSIDLLIGDERPGLYLVEVRGRDTLELFAQFGCDVPAFSPTPTFETQ